MFFNFSSQAIHKVLFVFLLAALTPYIYLSFFTHPVADDYFFPALKLNEALFLKHLKLYLEWNGRYFSNALSIVNPLYYDPDFYKLIPVAIILLSIASIYYFFRAATLFPHLSVLNGSIFFFLLYLFNTPSLSEGIYWFSSSITYQAGIIFALMYFGLLCNYFRENYFINKTFHLLLSVIFLFAAVGFNEVQMLLLLIFHVACLPFVLKQKKMETGMLIFISICFVSCLFVLFAPGNAIRRTMLHSNFENNHQLVHSLRYTFLQTGRFIWEWISNIPFIISSLLLLLISSSHRDKFFLLSKNPFKPVVSLLLLAGIVAACIFPAYWETSILGQHRTVNVACFFFLLWWFICILSYADKIKILFSLKRWLTITVLFVLLLSMFAAKNGRNVFTDVVYGKAKEYDKQMNERDSILFLPENKMSVVLLKPLRNIPKSIFVLDLSNDSAFFTNTDHARYF